MKRKWDKLNDEQRRVAIDECIHFFENERDETIGRIAAEQILNFFLASIGPAVYNQGVEDAKRVLASRMEDIQFDMDDLLDV